MDRTVLLTLFVFLSNFVVVVVLGNFVTNVIFNKALKNAGYQFVPNISLKRCLVECRSRKSRCQGVNYFRLFGGLCQLCEASDSSEPSLNEIRLGVVHVKLAAYEEYTDLECDSVNCKPTEKCIVRNNVAACVKSECESLPSVIQRSGFMMTKLGVKVKAVCVPGYTSFMEENHIICQDNATWSQTEPLCQIAPASCAEVKQCDNSQTDNEFWLYPAYLKGHALKVYCRGLQTESPTEFISLDEGSNFGYHENSDSCTGSTNLIYLKLTFKKIRVDIVNLEVQDDSTFVDREESGSINYMSHTNVYGKGSDCYHPSCFLDGSQRHGEFMVNLTGTGLMLSEETQWIADGHNPSMNIQANGRRLFHAFCGGHCGYCLSNGTIQMVIDTEAELSKNQAIQLTKCNSVKDEGGDVSDLAPIN